MYIPLKVRCIEIAGIEASCFAMRLPKTSISDHGGEQDRKLASKLIKAGDSHAKAMRGVIVYLMMNMQAGFMIEFETYRHGVECLSTSSSMHNELKGLKGVELAEKKQKDLPQKVYRRVVMVSYQALRNMYRQRRDHRHPDWQIFCDFVEILPFFKDLIYPEIQDKSN